MRSSFTTSAIVALIAATTITNATFIEQRATACTQKPGGSGPKPSPDTVSAFLALPAFSSAAKTASTPVGYTKQFSNLQAANTLPSGYLTFESIKSYDVSFCAARCNAIKGCGSFNIYYERGPSVEPGTGQSGCENPCSTTNIKCAFWSGIVTSGNAVNKGQYRNKFHVVIAGSNGYAKKATRPGSTTITNSLMPSISNTVTIATSATTTTAAAPACTSTANIFQVIGGNLDGQFLTSPDNNEYQRIYPTPGISNAQKYHLRADGRVFAPSNRFGWATGNQEFSMIAELSEKAQPTSAGNFILCSIESSSLVANVPNAIGVLSCRKYDGVPLTIQTCGGAEAIYQGYSAVAPECTPLTLAVIPVGSIC